MHEGLIFHVGHVARHQHHQHGFPYDALPLQLSDSLGQLDPQHLGHLVIGEDRVIVVWPLNNHVEGLLSMEGLLDIVNPHHVQKALHCD